jgi:multiple sugar transport system ATP-binding protein
MKDGVVQQLATPAEVYARPATRFVAEFIGSPAMNMVAAQAQGGALHAAGQALPLTPAQQAALPASGGVTYGLRPEALVLAATGLPGTLAMVEPTGPETYAQVDTALGTLTLRVPGNPALASGQAVHLQWQAADAHLFEATSGTRIA